MAPHAYPDEDLLERLSNVRLGEADIPEHEYIQFRRLQNLAYALRLTGYDLEAYHTETFIGAAMFAPIQAKLVVTRCEFDFEVNEALVQRLGQRLPSGLTWLTSNANIRHPRIHALPLGITDYCGYTPYHAVIGDTAKLKAAIDDHPRTDQGLVLLNFWDASHPQVRSRVRALFAGRPFVSELSYTQDEGGYRRYVAGLRSHAFCLSPPGNGPDTHRTWESLYAGTIPVVERSMVMETFSDLPILQVDRWEDALDPAALQRTRDAYRNRNWDLRKLTVSYWYQRMLELLGAT